MLIKYNKTNCLALGSFDNSEIAVLRPGWNEFPSHIWNKHEGDKQLKKLIEDGEIEFLKVTSLGKGKKKEAGQDAELHIKDLDETKAIGITKSTFNRDMLQRWIDEENRSKVKRALEKQMQTISPTKESA